MDTRTEVRKYRMNSETYAKVGSAWVDTKGGFLLGLADGECQGVAFQQSPRQWGAWRAYFRERGIKATFMDEKAKATASIKKGATNPHCYTVPTEWPHEFDPEATVQGDHMAGNWFMRNWRPEVPELADKARRQAFVAAHNAKFPRDPKPEKFDAQTGEVPPSFIDKDRLLEGYERDMAEQRARKAKPTQEQHP